MALPVVPAGLFYGARQPRTASWAKFNRPYGTPYQNGRSHADSKGEMILLGLCTG
jgi:hypothetical protein